MTDPTDPDPLAELDAELDATAAADPQLAEWDERTEHTRRLRAEAERVRQANRADPTLAP